MQIRRMIPSDIAKLNRVNLDKFTANFTPNFYFSLMNEYAPFCCCVEDLDGGIAGYIMGKIEYDQQTAAEDSWHGHISAISVSLEQRGRKIADALLAEFINTSFRLGARYVDLYVFKGNEAALAFYRRHGFSQHLELENYYGPGRAALDLRKYH